MTPHETATANTFAAATKLFVERGLTLADINLPAWCLTLNTTSEAFMAEVERQQSVRSLGPANSFEVEGK